MDKAPDAFRTISEVADELDVPQHVLRFWETRFTQIKPMKRSGGRRYYRPDDVDLLGGIRHLLYGQGYTIRGVQRILKEQGIKAVQNWQQGLPPSLADKPSGAGSGNADETVSRTDIDDGDDAADRVPDAARENIDTQPAAAPSVAPHVAANFRSPDLIEPPSYPQAEPPSALTNHLSFEHVARLRSTLDELIECRRLLDTVLTPH